MLSLICSKKGFLRQKTVIAVLENPNRNRRRLRDYRRRKAAFEKAQQSGRAIRFPLPIFEV